MSISLPHVLSFSSHTHTHVHAYTYALKTIKNWLEVKHLIIKNYNFCTFSISPSETLMKCKIKRNNSTWVLQHFLSLLVG